jgi:hypothetical protein
MDALRAIEDLDKLGEVYWLIEGKGKESEAHAKAVSRIWYFVESAINQSDVVDSAEAIQGSADLTEEDTIR